MQPRWRVSRTLIRLPAHLIQSGAITRNIMYIYMLHLRHTRPPCSTNNRLFGGTTWAMKEQHELRVVLPGKPFAPRKNKSAKTLDIPPFTKVKVWTRGAKPVTLGFLFSSPRLFCLCATCCTVQHEPEHDFHRAFGHTYQLRHRFRL